MSIGFEGRTAKARFKERMIAVGLWPRFIYQREVLKGKGYDPAEVWSALMPVFERLADAREETTIPAPTRG